MKRYLHDPVLKALKKWAETFRQFYLYAFYSKSVKEKKKRKRRIFIFFQVNKKKWTNMPKNKLHERLNISQIGIRLCVCTGFQVLVTDLVLLLIFLYVNVIILLTLVRLRSGVVATPSPCDFSQTTFWGNRRLPKGYM